MLLSGGDGYYSREITIEDTQFKLRELEDAETLAADEKAARVDALQEEANRLFERNKKQSLPEKDRDRLRELGRLNVVALSEFIDCVVSHGVVGWSLQEQCTPANVVRLPRRVKAQLSKAILQDTNYTSGLTKEEADFLASSSADSPAANQ